MNRAVQPVIANLCNRQLRIIAESYAPMILAYGQAQIPYVIL